MASQWAAAQSDWNIHQTDNPPWAIGLVSFSAGGAGNILCGIITFDL